MKWIMFGILSMGDLALTGYLLTHSSGKFYESNPVANWWLASYGWLGLIGFKIFICLLVGGLTAVIFLRRPKTAQRVVTLGCLVLTTVIIYSSALAISANPSKPQQAREISPTEAVRLELIELNREWDEMRASIYKDVAAGYCSEEKAEGMLSEIRMSMANHRRELFRRIGCDFNMPLPPSTPEAHPDQPAQKNGRHVQFSTPRPSVS